MVRQSLVFLASTFGLLATPAWAQEPTTPSFAGGYVGLALGYESHRVKIDNQTVGTRFRDTEGGVTVGGYAGYNWQFCPTWLFGVETDFNFINASPTAYDIEVGPTALTETTSLESRMDWFGTLRGRVGYLVLQDLLLYATGGLAYANVKHTLSDDCVGCGNSALNLGAFSQTNKNTKAGWTVGGGAELLQDAHWLLRAEGLYVDLGSETHTYLVVAPAGTGRSVAAWEDQFWVARLGLSYAFGTP